MFSKNRQITIFIMIAAVAVLIVWDIVALLTGGEHDTESHILLQLGASHFTLPFAMSGLLGHWFWPRDSPPFGMSKAMALVAVVVPVMLSMAVIDIFYSTPGWALPLIAPVGYVFGSLFWSQKKPH